MSGSYFDEKGVVDTQWSKGGSFTGNVNIQLAENLSAQWSTSYTNRSTRYVGDSNNRHGYILNVMRLDKGYRRRIIAKRMMPASAVGGSIESVV